MMLLDRRREMGGLQEDVFAGYTLIHDWEAEDYQDGQSIWTDRVGGISVNKKRGSPQRYGDYVKVNLNNYFHRELNSWANFGRDFKIELQFMYEQPSTIPIYVTDFGSVYNSQHAFCAIGISIYNTVLNNPKFSGNSSANTYEIPVADRFVLTPMTPITFVSGLVPVNDSKSILFNTYKGKTIYGANTYNGVFNKNFDCNELLFGNGTHASKYIGPEDVYIKSIKIYVKR